jgi:porin
MYRGATLENTPILEKPTLRSSRKSRFETSAIALALLLAAFAPGAQAQGASNHANDQDIWHRDTLTGDWGGARTALAKQGITFDLGYTGEALAIVDGGVHRGSLYEGLLNLGVDADLGKLYGWNGTTFHAQVFQIHGHGPSPYYVQNLMDISNIEAVPATRLYTLWLQQDLFDGRVSVRAGQLAADDEFVVTPSAAGLINGTFGWFTLGSANLPSSGPAYPLATPGIRLQLQPTHNLALLAAAFSGDPAGNPGDEDPQRRNRHGTNFSTSGGTFWIAEAQYQIGQDKNSAALPGLYRLGAWYHTGTFDDQRLDDAGGSLAAPGSSGIALQHHGDYAIYAEADQTVWREPGTDDQGASVFVRVGTAPGNRNLVDFYADGGLRWQGLLPGRDQDALSLGVAYARISGDAQALDRDTRNFTGTHIPIRDHEAVVELNYAIQMAPWWTLQPDIQYVVHPGGDVADPADASGTSAIPNAWVVGLRTTITF